MRRDHDEPPDDHGAADRAADRARNQKVTVQKRTVPVKESSSKAPSD